MVEQEILRELEEDNQKLSIKELADRLKRPQSSLYKYIPKLVENGLVWKSQKLVKGKLIAVYSVPSKTAIKPCGWKEHKEILLLNKEYTEALLDFNFWPTLREEIASLRQRDETLDVLICGLKGAGKSVSGLWLAHRLDPQFSVRRNVILQKKQLLELAARQPVNTAFLLDDLGTSLSSRAWAEPERAIVFDFFSICRPNRVHLVGTAPSADLVDVYFRRLIRYLMIVTLRCQDHVHIIIYRKTETAGDKLHFRPVGTLTLPYPLFLDPLIKEYELLKRSELRGSAKDLLAWREKKKEELRSYVFTHDVASPLSRDSFEIALASIGVDGTLSKPDRTMLRVAVLQSLEEKKRVERQQKQAQAETNKVATRVSKQGTALSKQITVFSKKYQSYIDEGKKKDYARTLAGLETDKRIDSAHLKKIISVSKATQKKGVNSQLVDRFVLEGINDPHLVIRLKRRNEQLDKFKGFPKDFTTTLFLQFIYDATKTQKFVDEVMSIKTWIIFQDKKGKFSRKLWQQSVIARQRLFLATERQKFAEEERKRLEEERWERIAHHATKLFGGLFGK